MKIRSVRILGIAAYVGLFAAGAQAQVANPASDDTFFIMNQQPAPDGGALEQALGGPDASGPVHTLNLQVFDHFTPGSLPGYGFAPDLRNGGGQPPIPEPVSWLTMLCGFAFIGFALRRRAGRLARA